MMSFKKIINIYIFLISFIINASSNKNKAILEYCEVDKKCDDCRFCGNETNDYTSCSYYNLFCIQNSNQIFFQESLLKKYTNFFRSIPNSNEFCGQESYNLDSLKSSFSIINKSAKDIKNSNINHCNYEIYNKKYYYSYDGIANLIIKLKTNNSKKNNIKLTFNIFLRDSSLGSSKKKIFNEVDLTKENYELILYNYDNIIILLDFYVNDEIEKDINEYLEIKINIDKFAFKNIVQKITIFAIIFSSLVVIIVIIVIVIYCRRKKNRNISQSQNVALQQKDTKEKQKVDKINKLFEHLLTTKEFNENDISNGCSECTICIEKFIDKCLICITPCKHIFHYECLNKFIETAIEKQKLSIKCPLCNYDFLEEKNDNKKLHEINNSNNEINNNVINKNEIDKNVKNVQQSIPREVYGNCINSGITSKESLGNNNVQTEGLV